jgi:hypothetical protein
VKRDSLAAAHAAAAASGRDPNEPFTDVWQFDVRVAAQTAFHRHHGANGIWAKLFRHEPGFIEIRLLKDASIPGRYLRIDRWRSVLGYARFATACEALDRACETLTIRKLHLGALPAHPLAPHSTRLASDGAGASQSVVNAVT